MLASDLVPLGRTPLSVSRLGLGTAPLGALPPTDDEETQRVLLHATRSGIRLIDTAPLYGFGRAESRIGRTMPEIDRTQLVLSTKVGRSLRPIGFTGKVSGVLRAAVTEPRSGARLVRASAASLARRVFGRHAEGGVQAHWPAAQQDLTYDGTLRSVEESLRRLQTDRIDILLIHEPEGPLAATMDGAYRALDRLRGEGAVSAIGVGANDSDLLESYARAGDFDCLLLGYRYTLLDQAAERSLLPYALDRGIAIIVGGPFNSGILSDQRPGATFDNDPASREHLRRADALEAITKRHGVSLKAAALRFPYRHPAVTSVLVGMRSVAELDENMELMQALVPDAMWDELRHEGLLGDPDLGRSN